MCFFIAEGYYYTKDVSKYTKSLFLSAFISHFAYVFASVNFIDWKLFIHFYYGCHLNQTSVMWSLAWGLVMLRVVNSEKVTQNAMKTLLILLICFISFPSDWSCIASLCILAFGTNRGNFKAQMLWMVFYVAIYATVYFFAIDKVYGVLQLAVVLAIPVIMLYSGQRSKNKRWNNIIKWLFYIYYPLHLFLIGWIQYAR